MRIIIGFIVYIFFTQSVLSQRIDQINIPAVTLNAFQLKFPNAQETKWKLDGDIYKIDYEVNRKSHFLKMDAKGTVLQHNQDLYVSEIPKVVLETIRKKATYFDINDADKYENESRITYEIKFKVDGKYSYFWVNENGKLLKYRKELNDSEIPQSIITTINKNYGLVDIDYAKYVEEGKKVIYIIRGEIKNADYSFTFDDKATILNHSIDLKDSEIPALILKTISNNYKDYNIQDADFKEENGSITYVVKLKNAKTQVYVTFNESGKILEVK